MTIVLEVTSVKWVITPGTGGEFSVFWQEKVKNEIRRRKKRNRNNFLDISINTPDMNMGHG